MGLFLYLSGASQSCQRLLSAELPLLHRAELELQDVQGSEGSMSVSLSFRMGLAWCLSEALPNQNIEL